MSAATSALERISST